MTRSKLLRWLLVAEVFALLSAMGCSTNHTASENDGGLSGLDGSSSADASDEGRIALQPEDAGANYNQVDSSGDCGGFEQDAHNGQDLHACCESVSCYGFCIKDGGQVACDCFGIVGGCPNGTICCAARMGCTAPGGCGLQH
jgi:hypothetical protein